MANGALHKVTELTSDTRHAMESVIGRSLREDEVITVNVFKPSPTGQARKEASRRLLDRIDRTAQKARGIPEGDIDAAIDEAVDHVRHHPE
jgi:hypothetical protein